jgi:hypothetical protein
MHEKISQDGTYNAPYAKGNFCFDRVIRGWRHSPTGDWRRKKK